MEFNLDIHTFFFQVRIHRVLHVLLAGADIVLGPKDFMASVDAVVAAVEDGTLPQELLDEKVRRVLTLKARLQ